MLLFTLFLFIDNIMGFWGTPVTVTATATNPIDSDVSTMDTLHKMIVLARQCASDSKIVAGVGECLKRGQTKHDLVRNIYHWVQRHVKFVEDEETLAHVLGYQDVAQELLIAPSVLLAMPVPMGDCDDFSMLTASMLLCAGIQCRYVVIAIDPAIPEKFSHVYCRAYIADENRWLAMDCSHGRMLGWEYQGEVYRRFECAI
jgi:transglutaminase-like putative cysteine protease